MSSRRQLAALAALAWLAAAASPPGALAHGIVGREDLPLPKWLFGWAAAVVLVVSFVALATLWRSPRLEEAGERRLVRLPRALDPLAGAFGIALFALIVVAGLAGSQTPTANLAPTAIFVIFWVGLAVVSALAGDLYAALSPWRALARALAWAATRVRPGLSAPLSYPQRLGRWPAALGLLAFVWVELIYAGRDEPRNLALLALAYAAVQLVGMGLYGIEPWSRRGDAFGAYFGLLARISPLRWTRQAVHLRAPLAGLTRIDPVPGTVALLCTVIGTTSFDGFTGGETWGAIAPVLTDAFRALGLGQRSALELAFTVGLVAAVLIVAGIYRTGVLGMSAADPDRAGERDLAARFAHSLVPIGFAYVVAHYFSLLAYEGQRVAYLASDPLGTGADLLGTAGAAVDYGWVSANAIWYVQVGALVIGHGAALVLAHDRALASFRDHRAATRSQYWMLLVMIALTSLGLWLLSAAS